MIIECYQTREKDVEKTWGDLHQELPHLAPYDEETKKYQWLGEGYYFWTDSDHFAHWWAKVRKYQSYCITSYQVEIEFDDLLDLSGNVKHAIYLKKLCTKLQSYVKEKNLPEPTICTTITYYRQYYKNEFFKFKAIKLSAGVDPNSTIKFTPEAKEVFAGIPRIQLCVFPEAKDSIGNKTPYYPDEYREYILAQNC